MKSKMKNLKVFAEVKKISTICFYVRKHSLAVCLQENEKSSFTLLLEEISIFFWFVMGRAGQGPPNRYVLACWFDEWMFV